MAPPTEQLIRDYLNRLSVAARGQLGPDDRRALVDRTRDFIERQTQSSGPLTALEVGRLLWDLGDPSALVAQERQRLNANGGELPEPPAIRNPIAKVLRRDSGKLLGASWHWPVVSGGRTDIQATLLHSNGAADDGGAGSHGTVSDATTGDRDRASSKEPVAYVPAQPGEDDWFFQALGGQPARDMADDSDVNSAAADVEDDETAEPDDDPAPVTVSPAWQLTTPRDPVLRRQLRAALMVVADWYRRRPLEASAVLILGLGGGIYPPVWLLGVVVALPSRVWDGRDKWLGLTLPVLVTIIAAWLGVTIGGHASLGHSLHEGWVFGVAGSRVAAVLSASYLCRRSVHERRPPAVPPWNRPHKVG
jgi:hypothetical protein